MYIFIHIYLNHFAVHLKLTQLNQLYFNKKRIQVYERDFKNCKLIFLKHLDLRK